ncbi:PEP-CTERM sorting domain-containing protein [Sedimenticola selenatireducens]|uniref:PEP-CTERM sorting domain-containing protein n=1 Tax=Sedimenticola selenatireducens TaxID=191960 RepID=UPI002354C026|nr:PEP-CTERM sorting domain-containing protein [Sedimenticola selenatireducens]
MSVVFAIALLPAGNALAVPVELVYQSDPQFGNTTFLLSYDSLADFANASSASSVPTLNNFATGGYLAGFTYDGSQYHLVYQSEPQFGNTTFLLSYDSLADFTNASSASSVPTLNNFATGGYLAGFTYDGSQYHLVYQSDPQFGNTTFLLSYDSLADFTNASSASSVPTLNNFATGGYLAGFNATIPESTVPEPHTLAMLLLGLSGIFIVRRQVSVVKNAGFAHIIRRSEGTP